MAKRGIKSSIGSYGSFSPRTKIGTTYGRVVDIILDSFHPEYSNRGNSQSINGIFYKPLSTPGSESEDAPLQFAFQGVSNIKQVPLKGEIVEIKYQPSETRNETPNSTKTYWTKVIPLWNHPHHNAYPDVIQFEDQQANVDLGDDFIELSNINPLQPFPGDLLIEGRYGQSIRFSGTKFESNTWTDSSNNGKPITIIRNGQVETDNGTDNILEDINEDASSIYLTSNHSIELQQSNEKRDSWNEAPEKADKYKGKQIILNSGRLYFNSRDESILLSSKEAFGVNAKSAHIDADDYIGLDAKKIYLGQAARRLEDEPVLLGQRTVDLLEKFLNQFGSIIDTMVNMPPSPPAAVLQLKTKAIAIKPVVTTLKNQLKRLPSKKVFTE